MVGGRFNRIEVSKPIEIRSSTLFHPKTLVLCPLLTKKRRYIARWLELTAPPSELKPIEKKIPLRHAGRYEGKIASIVSNVAEAELVYRNRGKKKEAGDLKTEQYRSPEMSYYSTWMINEVYFVKENLGMMRSLSNIVECNVSWRTHSTRIRDVRIFWRLC